MSTMSDDNQAHPDEAIDPLADAMKDQLRKEVATWRGARADGGAPQAGEPRLAVAKQPAPRAEPRARRSKVVSPVVPAAPAQKKPFSMAYDGVTEADYITYMISRGAR